MYYTYNIIIIKKELINKTFTTIMPTGIICMDEVK